MTTNHSFGLFVCLFVSLHSGLNLHAAVSEGAVPVEARSTVFYSKFESLKRQLVKESRVQLCLIVKRPKPHLKHSSRKGVNVNLSITRG